LAAISDDVLIDQFRDDRSAILIQKSSYAIDWEPMIHKQIADRQSTFHLGIESCAVVRQYERALVYNKALTRMPTHSSPELQKARYQFELAFSGKIETRMRKRTISHRFIQAETFLGTSQISFFEKRNGLKTA